MAAALLAVKFFRKGNDFVAAGFLVLSIGRAVMLSGTQLVTPEASLHLLHAMPYGLFLFC